MRRESAAGPLSDYQVGQRVQTKEGFPGTVKDVLEGPGDLTTLWVSLDNGKGGGEYAEGEVWPLEQRGAQLATVEHVASDDYPELQNILYERLPPALHTVGNLESGQDAAGTASPPDAAQVAQRLSLYLPPKAPADQGASLSPVSDRQRPGYQDGFSHGQEGITRAPARPEDADYMVGYDLGWAEGVTVYREPANSWDQDDLAADQTAGIGIDPIGPMSAAAQEGVVIEAGSLWDFVKGTPKPDADWKSITEYHSFDWCRFRRMSHCWLPKDLNEEASKQAGYAVWNPVDRGYCPRIRWQDQENCPTGEPGPHVAGGLTDATTSWDQGGQHGGTPSNIPGVIPGGGTGIIPPMAARTAGAMKHLVTDRNSEVALCGASLVQGGESGPTCPECESLCPEDTPVWAKSDTPMGDPWSFLTEAGLDDVEHEVPGIVRDYAMTPIGDEPYAAEMDDISRAYRDLPILDPNAVALWVELGELCLRQAEVLKGMYHVIRLDDSDPYMTADEMYRDVDCGIYKVTSLHSHHPVWTPDVNVAFRITHDLTGHTTSHSDFSLRGEVIAYQNQCAQTPEHLWPALFTEIVAQSAYANVHHLFGEQKVGVINLSQAEIDAHVGRIMDAQDPEYDALHFSASMSDETAATEVTAASSMPRPAEPSRAAPSLAQPRPAAPSRTAPHHAAVQSSLNVEAAFERLAAWRDIREKAKRLRAEGGVRIVSVNDNVISAVVKGDHGQYEVELIRTPGKRNVAAWNCGCRWASYSWGRSGPWKKFEGRQCSHALALQYEAQSGTMFGRDLEPHTRQPAWMDQSQVKHPGDYDKDTGRYSALAAKQMSARTIDQGDVITHQGKRYTVESVERTSKVIRVTATNGVTIYLQPDETVGLVETGSRYSSLAAKGDGVDTCKHCGSDDLWSNFYDKDGFGTSSDADGAKWDTLCQQCGKFQNRRNRKPKTAAKTKRFWGKVRGLVRDLLIGDDGHVYDVHNDQHIRHEEVLYPGWDPHLGLSLSDTGHHVGSTTATLPGTPFTHLDGEQPGDTEEWVQDPLYVTFDWVHPQIAVGGALLYPSNVLQLREQGVVGIISGRDDFLDETLALGEDVGVSFLSDPTHDDGGPKPTAWFASAIDFALPILQAGGKVYCHCYQGVNRGPSLAYAVLRAFTGMSPGEAFAAIIEARPFAWIDYADDADRALRDLGYQNRLPSLATKQAGNIGIARDKAGALLEAQPWLDRNTEAVQAGRIPGLVLDPNISPGLAGHAYHEGEIVVSPGWLKDSEFGRFILLTHEVGHSVPNEKVQADPEFTEVFSQFTRPVGSRPSFANYDNPWGVQSNLSEVIADGYSELCLRGPNGRYEDQDYPPARALKIIARAAQAAGMPATKIGNPSSLKQGAKQAGLDLAAIEATVADLRGSSGQLGICGRATQVIEQRFGYPKVEGFYEGPDATGRTVWIPHAWNQLPGGDVLDATADQFGFSMVRVVPQAQASAYKPFTPEQTQARQDFREEEGHDPGPQDWPFLMMEGARKQAATWDGEHWDDTERVPDGPLYHVAPASARASIEQHGLDYRLGPNHRWGDAKYPQGIYFFTEGGAEAMSAADFAALWGKSFGQDFDIWEVKPYPGLKVRTDPLLFGQTRFTEHPIPADKVKRVSPDQVKKIVFSSKDDGPSVSGVALKAQDTGRILMLQRSIGDEKDPAAGTWEFPGGHHEDGDTTSLHAAIREWQEEVGQPFPQGGTVVHTWRSPNNVYQGHVVLIPEESAVTLHQGRSVENPDDPDGDDSEQVAWWDPEHAKKNPALRKELKTGTPWGDLTKAASLPGGHEDPQAHASPCPAEPSLAGPRLALPNHAVTATSQPSRESAVDFHIDEFGSLFDQIAADPVGLAPVQAAFGDDPSYEWFPFEFAGVNDPMPDERLDDDPDAALPVTYGEDDDDSADHEADKVAARLAATLGGAGLAAAAPSPARPRAARAQAATPLQEVLSAPESPEQKGARLLAQHEARLRGEAVEGPDPFAHLGAGGSDNEMAAAAQTFLAKQALKTYTPAERKNIIDEGEGVTASNLDRLDIRGTHYQALEAATARAAAEDEDLTFLSGDPNLGDF